MRTGDIHDQLISAAVDKLARGHRAESVLVFRCIKMDADIFTHENTFLVRVRLCSG